MLIVWPPPLRDRVPAVDALRGLAILGMVLMALQPLEVLPAWMYHAQEPPPSHAINLDSHGLTWPDVVFPMFLFALGAAIPLALAPRLNAGMRYREVLRTTLTRAALLLFFALFHQHFDGVLSQLRPREYAWAIGAAGFVVLFGIYGRFPGNWSRTRLLLVRTSAWGAAVVMFALVRFPDGSRFRPERIDNILVVLAYAVVLGTVVWLLTRHSVIARLMVVACVAWLRLEEHGRGFGAGFVEQLSLYDPAPWLYRFSFFQYLCVVIPGTIVGDLLHKSMTPARIAELPRPPGSTPRQAGTLAIVLLLCVPAVVIGIQLRNVVMTEVVVALLCGAAFYLSRRPVTTTEVLVTRLVRWASVWLLIGVPLDLLEGGTSKLEMTLAWLFQSAGLAVAVTAAFVIIIDVFQSHRSLQLLVDTGQNPMIAYVAYGMVVLPVLGITTLKDVVDAQAWTPWLKFGWGALLTLIVALIARFFTRRRLFWRT